MKAYLKNYRQSPRKVRLVGDMLKGKRVSDALANLDVLAKRAGDPLKKLLQSAVANAKNQGKNPDDLIVKDVRIDKGIVFKRMMPAAMGSAHRINKRTSHVALVLEEQTQVRSKKSQVTK